VLPLLVKMLFRSIRHSFPNRGQEPFPWKQTAGLVIPAVEGAKDPVHQATQLGTALSRVAEQPRPISTRPALAISHVHRAAADFALHLITFFHESNPKTSLISASPAASFLSHVKASQKEPTACLYVTSQVILT